MITSGGLGTMGYGLPAAIGAKVAKPDCLVIGTAPPRPNRKRTDRTRYRRRRIFFYDIDGTFNGRAI